MKRLLAWLFVALALALPGAVEAQTITPTYGWITLTPRSVVPSPLNNGNCWTQSTGLFCRINGATVGPYISAGGTSLVVGSTAITSGTTGRVLYDNGGLLGELATTGSGSVVLGTSPTIATPTVTGSFTATGLVTNADLANAATTVNGQSCVLGATCTVSASASSLTIGTTTIGSGTSTRVLFDNAGVAGEYTATQLTAQINAFSSTLSGAAPSSGGGTTNFLRADGTWAAPPGATSGTVTSVATGTGLTGGTITTAGTVALASISDAQLLSNQSSGSAAPSGHSLSSLIDYSTANAQGDVLYRGASAWSALAVGTSGQMLQTQGASANPQWASVVHDKQVAWCGTCTVAADTLPVWVPQFAGTITSISYLTGAGSFTVDVTIAGSSMSTCNAVSVSSSTVTTTSCTGAHTFTSAQQINVVTSAISGSPVDALVQINYTVP